MKLKFIKEWIKFCDVYKFDFVESMEPNIYNMHDYTYFAAPSKNGYVYVFNNGLHIHLYNIFFADDRIVLDNSIRSFNRHTLKPMQYYKGYSDIQKLYNDMFIHQAKIDLESIGHNVHYRPFSTTSYSNNMANEFRLIKCDIPANCHIMTLEKVCFLQRDLNKNEIILCYINHHDDDEILLDTIFHVVTHDNILNMGLQDGKLLFSSIDWTKEKDFTFKDKILVNPFPTLQNIAGIAAQESKIWLPKHVDKYRTHSLLPETKIQFYYTQMCKTKSYSIIKDCDYDYFSDSDI